MSELLLRCVECGHVADRAPTFDVVPRAQSRWRCEICGDELDWYSQEGDRFLRRAASSDAAAPSAPRSGPPSPQSPPSPAVRPSSAIDSPSAPGIARVRWGLAAAVVVAGLIGGGLQVLSARPEAPSIRPLVPLPQAAPSARPTFVPPPGEVGVPIPDGALELFVGIDGPQRPRGVSLAGSAIRRLAFENTGAVVLRAASGTPCGVLFETYVEVAGRSVYLALDAPDSGAGGRGIPLHPQRASDPSVRPLHVRVTETTIRAPMGPVCGTSVSDEDALRRCLHQAGAGLDVAVIGERTTTVTRLVEVLELARRARPDAYLGIGVVSQ